MPLHFLAPTNHFPCAFRPCHSVDPDPHPARPPFLPFSVLHPPIRLLSPPLRRPFPPPASPPFLTSLIPFPAPREKIHRLQAVDAGTVAAMRLEERLEMDYRDRHVRVPAEGGTAAEPFRVMRADIDYNRHANNANYVRMGLELLPEGFAVRGLRVEYRVPARLGDVLEPTVYASGDGAAWTVVLARAGETSAIMEFTGGPAGAPDEAAP